MVRPSAAFPGGRRRSGRELLLRQAAGAPDLRRPGSALQLSGGAGGDPILRGGALRGAGRPAAGLWRDPGSGRSRSACRAACAPPAAAGCRGRRAGDRSGAAREASSAAQALTPPTPSLPPLSVLKGRSDGPTCPPSLPARPPQLREAPVTPTARAV